MVHAIIGKSSDNRQVRALCWTMSDTEAGRYWHPIALPLLTKCSDRRCQILMPSGHSLLGQNDQALVAADTEDLSSGRRQP